MSASRLSASKGVPSARRQFLSILALFSIALGTLALPGNSFLSPAVAEAAPSPNIVISQIYGAGGNSGALLTHDFVELFNRGSVPVSLTGWSIQYASATGTGNFGSTSTQITELPAVTLQPGQYFLVQQSGGATGSALPTPDFIDPTPIAMAAGAGKVAVANTTASLGCNGSAGQPCSAEALANIVDLIGYGNANFFEGTAAPTLSATLSAHRDEEGCVDTDNNAADFTAATPAPRNSATPLNPCGGINVIINEVDSDTPGTDAAEFIELYDGGTGNTSLDGLVVVFYNGSNDLSYRSIDLDTFSTNGAGYFTIGNAAVPGVDIVIPGDGIQNGQDAVALYSGDAASFPTNTPVTTANLVDAIVYDTADADDPGLLVLLNAGQPQVDESSTGASADVSNQRCPNGSGGARNTAAYTQAAPSPDGANNCVPPPDPAVPRTIPEIQGNGGASPFAGTDVITTGIVTALKTNGFFLQRPEADADPLTSEGIFVFTSSAPTVSVGDAAQVTGTAVEFFNLTEINVSPAGVLIQSTGNPLPASITLTTTILNPAGTVDQLERYEGMRVHASSVTSVAPTNNFAEIFAVLAGVPRPLREPGIEAGLPIPPDPTSGVPDCCIDIWDRNPERIMIDTDGRAGSVRLDVTSNVEITNITGPLDFTFDDYKIIPETAPVVVSPNMTAIPVPDPAGSDFTVAGYNIENFTGNATQRQKAALAIRTVLRSPDIIGHVEIGSLAALQGLANQVNSDTVTAGGADPQYQAFLIPATGTQHVGFLVKTARVQVNSVTQLLAGDTFINPVNGLPELLHDRPPLVLDATIDPTGSDPKQVIAVVNHLRSFIDVELVAGDGPRVRAKRKAQGEAIADLFQDLQTDNAGVPVISVGDYNAYQFSDGYTDPIATLKGMPTADDKIVVDASPDLVDPNFVNLTDVLPASERYSFIFEGTPQALDHVLVNDVANSMVQQYAIARMNADFPRLALQNNAAIPEGNSDHDAPVAYFKFHETTTTVSDVSVVYNVNGQNVQLSANVSAGAITVNEGTVTFTVSTGDGTIIGTTAPAAVTDGTATANFTLPGNILPQVLNIEASFSGGGSTLSSTRSGILTVTYAVCSLYDPTRAVKGGAVYPIKIQLCDVNGVNVSSASIVVKALNIRLVSEPDTDLEVTDSGNANPDNNFRFDSGLNGYIFNLRTGGLASGVYNLYFTAGADPTVHSVEFRVK